MAGSVYLVLLIAAVLARCVDSQGTCRPTIKNYGTVLGKINTVDVGGRLVKVETFWGIPYAQPPLGVLRFKYPLHPNSTVDVKEFRKCWVPPKACLQPVDMDIIHSAEDMSEDCLYYNVWKPLCNTTDMATIIYIHGGSLQSGSSAYPLYNGEYLAARECVIVASMNYRLGPLGFLYADAHGVSEGSMGIVDVQLAASLIQSAVRAYGGTESKITLVGSGAGAYIASFFLSMTDDEDWFSRIILQSGGPLMKDLYQSQDEGRAATSQLASKLNCSHTNLSAMVDCLRHVDAARLVEAYTKMSSNTSYKMVSVGDIDILNSVPLVNLRSQDIKDKPILIGTNRDEGTEILMKILPTDFNTSVTQPPVFSEQKLDQVLTTFLGKMFKAEFVPGLLAELKGVYNYEKIKNEANPTLNLLSPVMRDVEYTCPMKRFLAARTTQSQPVFMYSFNHAPDRTKLPAWVGATHRAELPYLFGTSHNFMPADLSQRETELSHKMQKMWADFANTGHPTPDRTTRPQWPVYNPQTEEMLVFTEDAQVISGVADNRTCLFWNNIAPHKKL